MTCNELRLSSCYIRADGLCLPRGKTRAMYQGCGCMPSNRCQVIGQQLSNSDNVQQGCAYASFNCFACSGESMPSVVQTSMPIPRTSRTMCKILSNPRLRPARSLHAAPMQNRVLPFSLALRAASNTGSMSMRRDAFVAV